MTPILYCDCCGLATDPRAGEDCPRCNYPIGPSKEEQFLTSAIRDLRRVATHGGANLTVADLIGRYQARLNYLHQSNLRVAPIGPPAVPPSKVASTSSPIAPVERPSEIIPIDLAFGGIAPPPPPVASAVRPPEGFRPGGQLPLLRNHLKESRLAHLSHLRRDQLSCLSYNQRLLHLHFRP